MHSTLLLDGQSLTLGDVEQVAFGQAQVQIHPQAIAKIDKTRSFIDHIAEGNQPHYGINTGFGALAETRIAKEDLKQLQYNLIVSHAVGVGEPLSVPEARALMLLRANTLAKGHSGCRSDVLRHLTQLLNAGCAPFIPAKGSVGASGDLAPLAHLALLLLGEGEAFVEARRVSASEALAHAKLDPLVLQAKEGLALINGTQAMAALGTLLVLEAEKLCDLADRIGATSLEALKGSYTPFDPRIHEARPHPGQLRVAENLRALLSESEIHQSHQNCKRVQDAYSLRCIPQVHGATRDTVAFVRSVLEREINSATDNPLVFLKEDGESIDILSGGNFHGQPLALVLDYLAIALSELANISERRLEQLLNPALSTGLPPFLAPNAGLNSGLMIIQVTAAALVSENKGLCHPASVDSIPTSANREDHVSMGMTSANKAKVVVDNVYRVLSIELVGALQGVRLRAPLKTSPKLMEWLKPVESQIAFAEHDRHFSRDLETSYQLCRSGKLGGAI